LGYGKQEWDGHALSRTCRTGREPGAGFMREVEGRAEALAGTFTT